MTERDDDRVRGAADRVAREEERAWRGRRIIGVAIFVGLVIALLIKNCAGVS